MDQATLLLQLQENELEYKGAIELLQRVRSQLANNREWANAKKLLEAGEEKLAKLQKEQRFTETEVDDLTAKSKSLDQKLYGGSIKNSKELHGLQQETEYIKTQTSNKEEHLLTIMSQIDDVEKNISVRKEELANIEDKWQIKEKKLQAQQTQLEATIAQKKQTHEELVAIIDHDNLELYKILSKGRQGQAVAKLQRGKCSGCHIVVPVNQLQQARLGRDIIQCCNCERILCNE